MDELSSAESRIAKPVESKNVKEPIATKKNVYLLIGALVLGLIFNILFYRKTLGLSYPIFVLAFYGILIWVLRDSLRFKISSSWILSIPIFLLSLTYLIFSNEIFRVLNIMAIPVLIVTQTILVTDNNRFTWHSASFLTDLLHSFIVRPLAHVFKPFILISEVVSRRTTTGKYKVLVKILIGLLLSAPLMAVVIGLLASADDVFRYWLEKISNSFIEISVDDFIGQTMLFLLMSIIFFSYIWSLMYKEKLNYTSETSNSSKKSWDSIIVITVLVMINSIYVLFTLIQFSYLFGSVGSILPPDTTYSEYARRGFFELILVTLINLSILLLSIKFTDRANKISGRLLRILDSLLVGCTLVMLLSAHFRMAFYEEAYGYTYLRILTHAFMIFIFAIMLVTLVKVWRENIPLLKSYILIALVSYLMLNYINIDVIIAKNNIRRYAASDKIDAHYLTYLSYDAIPHIIGLLKDEKQEVARQIENHLYTRRGTLEKENDWQSFNISKFLAEKILKKHELTYEGEMTREYRQATP